MRIGLMVEGQEDVTWDQWVALATASENADRGSLDEWATLAVLAAVTERIRLGTLVSPATSRRPSVLAKMVVTADHVSDGRIELGMGAGGHEAEHVVHGFPFPPPSTRLGTFEEQVEIVHRSWGPTRWPSRS